MFPFFEEFEIFVLKKFIGNREFYKRVIALSLPIMIQNGITNFVNMLDNVMVGQVGTVQMTGVAIANQLIFVFNLCVFGALSGAGIFGAQFFGNGDHKGVRYTFRFKLVTAVVLSIIGVVIFLSAGEPLISLYLRGEGDVSDAAASLEYSKRYLHIMLIGICPWALSQAYASTLRETGKSLPPMIAGVVAVLVNLALNYVLIFGHFGAPALGVEGAAIATVISRFCELLFIAGYTACTKEQNKFIVGAFKSLFVPLYLVKNIFVKGIPLMLNETLWASGFATLNQCYSERGLFGMFSRLLSLQSVFRLELYSARCSERVRPKRRANTATNSYSSQLRSALYLALCISLPRNSFRRFIIRMKKFEFSQPDSCRFAP